MTPDALFWLTVGPYVAAALVALVADAFARRDSRVGVLGSAALLAAGGAVGVVGGWTRPAKVVYDVFVSGGGFSTAAGLVGILAAVSVAARFDGRSGDDSQGSTLIALAASGYAVAATSCDLLALLLALEIAGVSSYALTATARARGARQVALRYFILSALATGFALMGLVVMSGLSGGTTGYVALNAALADLSPHGPVTGAVVLIVMALLLKLGAAPLHFWAPDVYESAPPAAAGFLAGAGKLATGMALANFVALAVPTIAIDPFRRSSVSAMVVLVLLSSALLSLIVGALGALAQRGYARMLGYAGIAQVGYALIAIAAFNQTGALIFLSTYAIATTAAFTGAQAVRASDSAWDGSIDALGHFGGLERHTAIGITVALASLAGLPPLLGFWGKFEVFAASVTAVIGTYIRGPQWASITYTAVVTTAVLAAVVSVAYYGSVIRALFSGQVRSRADGARTSASSWLVIVVALLLLALGSAPAIVGFSAAMTGFTVVL